MPESVAILTNEFSPDIFGSRYYVGLFAQIWREQGIEVHVTAGCNYIPADIAILHVDETIVGEEYLELAARYPVTVNCKVRDISKSAISEHIVMQDDSWDGPVIVKTDANAGGFIEYKKEVASSNSIYSAADRQRPWRKREFLDSYKYPVFDSIREVPRGVWRNRKLIVEKFLPERLENGDFMHRCYLFFGNREVATWFAGPAPVVKGSISTSSGLLDRVPEELRKISKTRGFDFGRFDYLQVDGEIIVSDMNRTPVFSEKSIAMIPDEEMLALANAIYEFE